MGSARPGGRRLLGLPVEDPTHRLGEAFPAHRLHDVVGRIEVEGVDGIPVIGGDEDDLRALGEPGEHPGQVHPVEAGHRDIREDDIHREVSSRARSASVAEAAVRIEPILGSSPRRKASSDRVGGLVVDEQRSQPRARPEAVGAAGRLDGWLRCHRGRLTTGTGPRHQAGPASCERSLPGPDPGANFGTRKLTLVPAPGAVSTTRPCWSPKALAEAGVDISQADAVRRILAGEDRADHLGVRADAIVLDDDLGALPDVGGGDRHLAVSAAGLQPVPDGVLDEGLDGEEGTDTWSTSGRWSR